jgi:hypothetical protein
MEGNVELFGRRLESRLYRLARRQKQKRGDEGHMKPVTSDCFILCAEVSRRRLA